MVLRDRQKEIFCQRWTADLCRDSRQAAIDAGIDPKEAGAQGRRWETDPAIIARTNELLRPLMREHDITRARIVEQYARIAFSDPRRCFDEKGIPLNISEMPFDDIAALSEYTMTKFGPKLKFESRKPALDKLAEIMRVIAPEGTDSTGVTVNLVNFSLPPSTEFD